uniref:Methyl-CpG-binding domain-containing protein 9 n=1 Tax=Tanacetum cinerariifolium TaxID=118510 RepID=A0A699IZL7_TANCI|nr:methyl-CpG-binding domain-containing protein 9 [Tanacetum cinerariifolium]
MSDIETGDLVKETNVINVDIPDWAQALEPTRKLPTNAGARIRRCIKEVLDRNPPEWAKKCWSTPSAKKSITEMRLDPQRPVLKPNDPDDVGVLGYPTMVSRPFDFRTIDLRQAAGFYVSHQSFIEDVHEVLDLGKFTDSGNNFDSSSEERKKDLSSLALETSEDPFPAAPWEDGSGFD